jgi:hypothetical protein
MENPNSKYQMTNNIKITNSNDETCQSPSGCPAVIQSVLNLRFQSLVFIRLRWNTLQLAAGSFICHLRFVIWNFNAVSSVANNFNRTNQR